MLTKHLPLVLTISILCAIGSAQASSIRPPASKSSARLLPWATPSSPDYWLGGTGYWSNSADWTAGLPGSGSDVNIVTGSDTVILDTSSSINSLTLGGGPGSSNLIGDGNAHTLTIAGALTVDQSGNLSLAADTVTAGATSANLVQIDLEYGSSLQVNGDFSNSGTLSAGIGRNSTNNALIIAGTLTNSGTINLAAGPYAGGQASVTVGGLVNTGTMNMTSSNGGFSTLQVNGNANNSGQINDPGLEVYDGYGLSVSGNFINSGSIGTSAAHNDSISVGGTFMNTSTGILGLGAASATFGALVNQGTVSIQDESSVKIAGAFTNNTGALLDIENSYASMASLVNEGSITMLGFGEKLTAGSLMNSGSISSTEGGTLRVNGDATNSGQITGSVGFTMNVAGKLTNNGSGLLSLDRQSDVADIGYITNAGTVSITNGATLNVTGGTHAAVNALPGFLNTGIVNISAGSTLASPLTYTQTSGQTTVDGTLQIGGLGNINFAGGSVYGNGGTIQGSSIISNAAINIGDSPMTIGQLFMMGNYTQGANGSLTFDIAGAASGQYDQLNVSGKAQFNGLMTVNLLNGYVPQIGNMFDIMNFASGSGTFSKVLGLPINNQEHFVLEYNSTNLTLDVVQGQDTNLGDGASSIIASSITWVSNRNGVNGGASNNGISDPTPEPSSILLVGSGLVGIAAVLRRKGESK